MAEAVVWQVDIARGAINPDGLSHYILTYKIENPNPCEAAEIAMESSFDESARKRFPDWPVREVHVTQMEVPWSPVFVRRPGLQSHPVSVSD